MTDDDAAIAGRMFAEESAHDDPLEGAWDGTLEEAAGLVVHPDAAERARLAHVVHKAASDRWMELVLDESLRAARARVEDVAQAGRSSEKGREPPLGSRGGGAVITGGVLVVAGDKVAFSNPWTFQPTDDPWRVRMVYTNGVMLERVFIVQRWFGYRAMEVFVPCCLLSHLRRWRAS